MVKVASRKHSRRRLGAVCIGTSTPTRMFPSAQIWHSSGALVTLCRTSQYQSWAIWILLHTSEYYLDISWWNHISNSHLLVSCRRNMASLVRRFSWRWAIWQVNILDYLKYISGIRIRIAYFGQFNPTKSETNHHPVGCLAPCNYIEYKVQTTDVNPNKRVSNWVISFPHFTINALTFTPPAQLGESGFTLWNTSPYVLIETEELVSDIFSSCWSN